MLDRFKVPEEIAVRVGEQDVRATTEDIFGALGFPEDDARRAADVLVYADVRGIDTHGVSNMLRRYVEWVQSGEVNPTATPFIVREAAGVATIDGDRGLGVAVGPPAMELAMDKAANCGVGTVLMTNSRHYGAAAYFAAMAPPRDMIGVSMTIGGIMITPTYGAKAMLGLNPIGVAAPAGREVPYIFDASMSAVAGNKITLARRMGETVLPGWIAEADGTPVMDERPVPDEFLMLPLGATREIGSHKGYGLALMVDVVTGVLSGTGPGYLRRGGIAHHFTAYDVEAFVDTAQFKADMDTYLRDLRETPTAPGADRVYYAGLMEHEEAIDRRERGIPYHPEVVEWFAVVTAELRVTNRVV
jgi:L-2-hydroxycarboxylate dehydrogenase (NAD+)